MIGKVIAESNGNPIGETPLIAQADVERAGFMLHMWQRLVR
ncbi:hypothetical protein J2X19_001785 [Rhodoferax ferrireducens]|uniref:Uncharacterized protein n=1 Tax=Rhodoferax ferrireducens TaxID=192843 RepID=A0ABU2C710_9BURK|nr:hypothetical protein [Rhodoferax ferrireducens]MDR7377127.1 hypothetical protein [Rhodoferax ferrireducens]